MRFWTKFFGKSPEKTESEKITDLLETIANLESRINDLTKELQQEIKDRQKAESNEEKLKNQNKHIVEQNNMFKLKLEDFVRKQSRVISIVTLLLQNSDIDDKENIQQLLDL